MDDIIDETKDSKILRKLFSDAEKNRGIDYIYTLLRVTGIVGYKKDPLLHLRDSLKQIGKDIKDEELPTAYQLIIDNEEHFNLIVNLINCVKKKPYNFSPFQHLYSGKFPNIVKPSIKNIAIETAKIAMESNMEELSKLVATAFPEKILDNLHLRNSIPDMESLKNAFKNCRALLLILLRNYFSELLKFRELPRFHKLPHFEVLELLVNEETGLFGFKMHFSNGASARFIRGTELTECININLEVPINFMVGFIPDLKQEWRIGDKRLYEVGLPGRYNKLGEWKPIIYPGESKSLERDALSMSDDPDVSGSIFYMMCTGHRVIEFVVRTSIEMPLKSFSFGKQLHFFKCPFHNDIPNTYPNLRIYDGWLELDSIDPEHIRASIAEIGVGINRMAFAYNQRADWRIKYRMTMSPGSCATPSKDDLRVLDKILREFPKTEDAIVLDAAIDWYNRGKLSRNVFTSYLCNYIALESVAIAVADGNADLGLDYHRKNKQKRKQKRIECIQEKYNEVYETDPERFVREAYFDCIHGTTRKVRQITEKVFGADHKYYKSLFEEKEGLSLSDIRSNIAHGEFTLIDKKNEALVRKRLHEIDEICKEFLVRIIFLLKPKESLPQWSQMFDSYISSFDPRNTLVVTKKSMLQNNDWSIRPEWCD